MIRSRVTFIAVMLASGLGPTPKSPAQSRVGSWYCWGEQGAAAEDKTSQERRFVTNVFESTRSEDAIGTAWHKYALDSLPPDTSINCRRNVKDDRAARITQWKKTGFKVFDVYWSP
jgi:hypothetical protein